MRRVAIATIVVSLVFAGCGDIGSKPNEPVEGGGSTTSPNIGFPGTNSATNAGTNSATNNEATNNVFIANNAANSGNVSPNNVGPNAPTNSVTTCGAFVPPAGPVGFASPPPGSQGFIVSVTSTEMVIEFDGGERATFDSVGLDLTDYFIAEEFADILAATENENETRYAVSAPSGFIEYISVSESGSGDLPNPSSQSQFGIQFEQLDASIERCQVEGPCGLQDRSIGTPEVLFAPGQADVIVNPGETGAINLDGFVLDVHVIDSRQDIVEPLFTDTCEAEGSTEAEIQVLLGTAAP